MWRFHRPHFEHEWYLKAVAIATVFFGYLHSQSIDWNLVYLGFGIYAISVLEEIKNRVEVAARAADKLLARAEEEA